MLMTPQKAAELTANEIAGLSAEEFAAWEAHERLRKIDLFHIAGEEISDVFDDDVPLQKALRELQHLADAKEWGGGDRLGELDYEADVDVTAEPEVPDQVVVGRVRWRRDSWPVVVESKGVEVVGGRKVKKYVGRVAR